jgi:hypothetical protein
MTGVHPARLQKRNEKAHGVIKDAIARGHLQSGETYVVRGITGADAHANAFKALQAVRSGAGHLGVSVAVWVTEDSGDQCWKSCKDASAPHGVSFRIFPKNAGRRHVVESTGGDPSKLKYSPFARQSGPVVDDNGRPI